MKIVLWDTRRLNASKDFAGGMGVGMWPVGGGWRGGLIRRFYTRDRRPVALCYAYLAAAFRRLGHEVEYAEDRVPDGADLYVFCPSLVTIHLEQQAIAQVQDGNPSARVLVIGTVASVLPEMFQRPGVTVVKGEPEQLLWRLDEVLHRPEAAIQLGSIEDLDSLPMPDWSPFDPGRFRIGYDFWRFPTALVQASRGCPMKCNYCPYIVVENSQRLRSPESVVEEIRYGMRRWGFASFKFRDPLFGANRKQLFRLVELLGRLPRRPQFSIETRIDLMPPETLRVLQRLGLTSITVGIETPDAKTLRRYHRVPMAEDRQVEFVALCRSLGIRTVAGFMIGFPEDTRDTIAQVVDYAKRVGPTYANFNVVTPYPGTEFFEQVKDRILDFDFSRYSVYTPVLRCDHLTPEELAERHQWCARRYYFRWDYLWQNAGLLFPWLRRFGVGGSTAGTPDESSRQGPPRPLGSAEQLQKRGLRKDAGHGH